MLRPLRGCTPNPILSDGFGHMFNLDLADLRSMPDRITFPGKSFEWFGVLSDHFTGYILGLFPLETKESPEVALFVTMLFGSFGFPLFLINDNGTEFLGALAVAMKRLCGNKCRTICTRPRNPKANGAAESNVKWSKAGLIRAIQSRLPGDPSRYAWAGDLALIQRARNEGWSKWRNTSFHRLLFGRKPVSEILDKIEELNIDLTAIEASDDPVAALSDQVQLVAPELFSTDDKALFQTVSSDDPIPAALHVRGQSVSVLSRYVSLTLPYFASSVSVVSLLCLPQAECEKTIAEYTRQGEVNHKAIQVHRGEQWVRLAKKRNLQAKVGDNLLLNVDYRERRALDPQFLLAVVMQIDPATGGCFCASGLDGMLKGLFFVGDQCAIPSTDITDVWGMREVKVALLAIAASEADLKAFLAKPRISVASAERAMTKWTEARITGVCMCTGKCNTKSCSCFKHGLCCSSKCHKGAFVVFSSCVVFSRVCVASDLVAPAVRGLDMCLPPYRSGRKLQVQEWRA